MTTPPWGHKPPPVDDIQRYWGDPPPEPSERCVYWLRRYREGSWRPNKHLSVQGYYGTASWLGVYIWEAINIFYPVIEESRAKMRQSERSAGTAGSARARRRGEQRAHRG
jgi:hypothetical protein